MHWDEDCLLDELMTGYVVGTRMPLSTLTIASLEDSGYPVDYSVAGVYDGSDTTCCFSSASIQSIVPSKPRKPPLSDEGRATAVAYGRKKLIKNRRPPSIARGEPSDGGVIYLGDLITTVLFIENGLIYDVHVTKE